MQYQIKFYDLNWQTYNVPLHINKALSAASSPTAILQVIVDNEFELLKLSSLKNFSKSRSIIELMSEVLISKGMLHDYVITDETEIGGKELFHVVLNGCSYHYPFDI